MFKNISSLFNLNPKPSLVIEEKGSLAWKTLLKSTTVPETKQNLEKIAQEMMGKEREYKCPLLDHFIQLHIGLDVQHLEKGTSVQSSLAFWQESVEICSSKDKRLFSLGLSAQQLVKMYNALKEMQAFSDIIHDSSLDVEKRAWKIQKKIAEDLESQGSLSSTRIYRWPAQSRT